MEYFLCDNWGGSPLDAKKTVSSTEDDLMCWAAAASNVLAWTKWGFPSGQVFNDETSIFKYFQGHWLDISGFTNEAWEWWFDGKDRKNVDVSGGGFWKASENSFGKYYHVQPDRRKALSAIAEFLGNGYGVVLELMSQNGGHYLTCWGYKKDDDGRYVGIYTTDSDDTSQNLRYYELTQDMSGQEEWARFQDWWYLTYHNNSTRFLLATVHALDRCPENLTPDNLPPSAPTNLGIV